MMRIAQGCVLALVITAVPSPVIAANRAIEDVRLSRQGGISSVDIVLVCPADYLDHSPPEGTELTIRVGLASACVEQLGTGIRAELHEPPRTTVAAIRQVRYDTRDGREARIVVTVSPSQHFRVSQGRARNVIHVELVAPQQPQPAVITQTTPAPAPSSTALSQPPAEAPPATREPLRLVQRPPPPRERFALQIAAGADAANQGTALPREHLQGRSLYVNEHSASDGAWQELRLGFFSSEQEAREFAATLPAAYANSIVVVAPIAEQERAVAAAPATAPSLPVTEARRAEPLTAARIAELGAIADEALRRGDHDTAVRTYSRLLEEPTYAERRIARERLGVARERKGQLAQARAEYQAYLAEFPDGPDSVRVRQRLAGLAAGSAPVAVASAEAPSDESSVWDITGGTAQYVRYFELERAGTTAPSTEHSSLWSNVNLVVRRDGERFDLTHRIDAAYQYNLLDEAESSAPADQFLVSNAYVDVTDAKHDWEARIGRQSRYGSGIVGRFDGAHVSYQWRPEIALSLALGNPVDYPRHAIDSHRHFVGFSADLDRLVKQWDFSFFGILQTVDGIADREAVGAEARYRGERWHVVTAADVDLSYSVLNSALVNATWRANEKLTFNGRYNGGAAPFIATRNALIGQSAVLIETMLDTYTEPQLRRIARDRTAQVEQTTIGLSRSLLDRFQLNADVGYYASDATAASAGVIALPSTKQSFLNLAFVGSSVLADGDSAVFSFRHTDGSNYSNDTLTFDVRLPTRGKLRLNPRLALSSRRYADGSSDEWIAAPMLRLAVRWPNRHQFELELGARQSTRELAPDGIPVLPDEESTETFINAGYWWELGR
jgi:hypothetical protein